MKGCVTGLSIVPVRFSSERSFAEFANCEIQNVNILENSDKMASFLEDSSKTMMEIRDDLICEVCKGGTRPGKSQWYRCSKLHLICLDCKTSNKNCSCGKPISEEHCKIIEKLLSVKGLKFHCANTKHGCREVLLESALEGHESECLYKLLKCPVVSHQKSLTVVRLCNVTFVGL